MYAHCRTELTPHLNFLSVQAYHRSIDHRSNDQTGRCLSAQSVMTVMTVMTVMIVIFMTHQQSLRLETTVVS